MKQSELKPCAVCGKGVMHCGLPVFWRLTVERFGVDRDAVRRRAGLEMLVGSPVIAAVLGPDEHIAKPVQEAQTLIICEPCMLEKGLGIVAAMEDERGDEDVG